AMGMPAVVSLRCASLCGRENPCARRRHAECDVAHVAQPCSCNRSRTACGTRQAVRALTPSLDRQVSRIVRPLCLSPFLERVDLAFIERGCHTVPLPRWRALPPSTPGAMFVRLGWPEALT